MKKIILTITVILVLLISAIYTLLFTSTGNSILKPIIQEKINDKSNLHVEIDQFYLRMDNFKLLLKLSENNTIYSQGYFSLFSQDFSINYNVKMEDLTKVQTLSKQKLKGQFFTKGTVKGDFKKFKIDGTSTLARSSTRYNANIKNMSVADANIYINNLNMQLFLKMIGQKNYLRGRTDLHVEITSTFPMNADISLNVKKAIVNTSILEKDFGIKVKQAYFNLNSKAIVKNDLLTAKTDLNTNLFKLNMKKTSLDINTQELKTDYNLHVDSLAKLESILGRKLNGRLDVNGDITKNEHLSINAYSNIFNGKLKANIKDENLKANFTNLHVKDISQMLGYPEVVDAPLNGTLTFNTKLRKGKLNSSFEGAVLLKSKMTDTVQKFTKTALTKQRFNKGSLVSDINGDIIKSKVKMESKKTKFKSKKFVLDTKKELIDARFNIKIKKYSGDIIVTKNIKKPKVQIDFASFLDNPKTKKKINREINRILDKLF